ncbi:glycosyl transferase, family 2 [Chitinispirillum alkaliphilum]|nr:glycosyl transferase, family 2 [Chitinispirillum alkaliphilum]
MFRPPVIDLQSLFVFRKICRISGKRHLRCINIENSFVGNISIYIIRSGYRKENLPGAVVVLLWGDFSCGISFAPLKTVENGSVLEEKKIKMSVEITVCVCTYKRPEQLNRLLEKLKFQSIREQGLEFRVVVVDNDSNRSAEQTVERVSAVVNYTVIYVCEPQKNISTARNAAARSAGGSEFVAFIDDDEFPDDNWLSRMHKECTGRGVTGVMGPVEPHFPQDAPAWLVKSGLCNRKRFKTGTPLHYPPMMRTGNVLLKTEIFSGGLWFDPKFGLSGGEDKDFFTRALQLGYSFMWCDEGVVFEEVSPARLSRKYHLKRALLRGALNGRKTGKASFAVFKSAFAFLTYSLALPLLSLRGHHLFMRYLVRSFDHIGLLLSVFGVEPVKDRESMGG